MTKHTPNVIQPQLPFSEIPYGYCHCGCGQKTRIARKSSTQYGWVKGEPVYFVQGHGCRVNRSLSDADRFWAKVKKGAPDECWIWEAALQSLSYGRFQVASKKVQLAHRYSYEMHYGPIPDGMFVCHTCDNPPCVNPAHLFAGTPLDNMIDKHKKGRYKHARGEKIGTSKLTDSDVLAIRNAAAQGETQKSIAARYGLHRTAVYKIVRYKRWTHVE